MLLSVFPKAYAVTQEEIDEAKAKRDEVSVRKSEQQAIIDSLAVKRDDILAQKKALEEKITLTYMYIQYNDDVINLYDQMIAEKAEEVDNARELELEQLEKYRARVRAMEENGELNVLAIILQTNTFSELLTAIDDMGEIMQSDKELEDHYIEARENHEKVQKEYEEYKADLEEKQAVLRDEKVALETEIKDSEKQVLVLQSEINQNADILAQIDAEWAEANAAVNNLINKLNAQRAAAMGPGSLTGAANFIWPCGTTYLTSRFGNRLHPISGVWKNHTGVDIGAGYGDTVWAAAPGTVSLAEYYGSYGNCVMIDHLNGYYTLYGHLSSIAVSNGQLVTAGQTIGYVGSTGNSTGAHLHFEIRQSGQCLNPESFFPAGSLSFSADAGE
jgi:Membrane proteins related to metalloendopeptidases